MKPSERIEQIFIETRKDMPEDSTGSVASIAIIKYLDEQYNQEDK